MKRSLLIRANPLAINAMANVIQMVVGAALLFALYRYINGALGVAQLGVWSVVIATVSASRLADLGLSAGVTRFVAREQGRGDAMRAAQVVDTATITLMVAVGLLLPLFYYLAGKALPYAFQAENLEQAKDILPLAMASLWLTIVASVFQGGLEGCQRMGLRAGLALCSQLLLLLLSIWLVPIYGLAGLAWAQVGQGVFLVGVGRLLLIRVMPQLHSLPRQWQSTVLREMLSYGVNLQASTMFILLFDPMAKALIARFGGAGAAGLFEMASQVVIKIRAVIVAANQAVVPHVAGWSVEDPVKLESFYRENMRALIFVTLPTIALLIAATPVISWLLIGEFQLQFVGLTCALAIAWGFNILASPAYFLNLGTGHVGANTLAHAATGVVSVLLGLMLGPQLGLSGIVVGYISGIFAGTALLIFGFMNRHGITLNLAGHTEHVWLLGSSLVVASWGASTLFRPLFGDITISAAALIVSVLLVGTAAWFHALRVELFKRLEPARQLMP